jgi:hypothetical protein
MAAECNSDLLFKIVQDLEDISNQEAIARTLYHAWRIHEGTSVSLAAEEMYERAEKKLDELKKTTGHDTALFFMKCIQPKSSSK